MSREQLLEPKPLPVPEKIQQHIFGFYPRATPDLLVAAYAVGNFAPVEPQSVETIDQAQTYVPAYDQMPKGAYEIKITIANSVQDMWQMQIPPVAQSSALSPNWLKGDGAIFTPLTTVEHDKLMWRVGLALQSERARALTGNLRSRHCVTRGNVDGGNLGARLLGVAHDLVAIPRMIAAQRFVKDRTQVVKRITDSYRITEDGHIHEAVTNGVPDNPTELLERIVWQQPCLDLLPPRTKRSSYITNPMTNLMQVCEIAADITPYRLCDRPEEVDPEEFHSPFRVTSFALVWNALQKHKSDERALTEILDAFFTGNELPPKEPPRPRVYPMSPPPAAPVEVRRSNVVPPETQPVLSAAPEPEPPKRVPETWEQHTTALNQLYESDNPLARKLIDAVTNGEQTAVELCRAERFGDRAKLSKFVHGRLRNVARIFYGSLFTSEDTIPPDVEPIKNEKDIIRNIIGNYAGRVQAVHLKLVPDKDSDDKELGLRVAIVVEKRSTGHPLPTFEGAHFSIAIKSVVEGSRRVVIKKEGRIERGPAERLIAEEK